MKSLLRLRQSLAVVAIVELAACSAAQNVSPNVGAGSNFRLGPTGIVFNHGGTFKAAQSGTYSKSGDCSDTARLSYKGNGHARFLHASSEQISLTVYCGARYATGSATLTSVRHPGDSITASVSGYVASRCDGFTMPFTITSGTGRFANASGSGTIVLKAPSGGCPYTYTDKWSGTLTF